MLPERDTLALNLGRSETLRCGPWLIGAFTHHGHGHAAEGLPNQDAYRVGRVGDIAYMVVADGVSSAPLSQLGAELAVTTAVKELVLKARMSVPLHARTLESVFTYARMALEAEARRQKKPLSDFATTLLIAVMTKTSLLVGKIGDGSVLAVEEQRAAQTLVPLVDSPHTGDGVVDLTHRSWRTHLKCRLIADHATAGMNTLALATDGASGYFIVPSNTPTAAGERTALSPRYIGEELAKALRERQPRDMLGYFTALMFIKAQKDGYDDKTLTVATWIGEPSS